MKTLGSPLEKIIKICDFRGKTVIGAEGLNSSNTKSTERWYEAVSALAKIQQALLQRIPAPKNMQLNAEDFKAIGKMRNIVEKGELPIIFKGFTLVADKEMINKLIEMQITFGKIAELKMVTDESFEQLFNQTLSLGPAEIDLPDMQFEESIDFIERKIGSAITERAIELRLIPHSNTQTKIVYSKWKHVPVAPS